MENPVFLQIKLDNIRALKDLSDGERLFNNKKIKEALNYFKKAEKECKLFKGVYYTVTCLTTFGLGLPLAGIMISDTVNPIYKGLAHCYFWLDDYLEAIKYFGKINEKDYTDYYIEAWARYRIGDLENSKSLFKNCLEKEPTIEKYIPVNF